jgi:hypothetical protein
LKRGFDKRFNAVTHLTFDSLAWLKQKKLFPSDWHKEMQFLKALTPKNAFDVISKLLNPKTGQFDTHPILELARLQGKVHTLSAKEPLSLTNYRRLFGTAVKDANHQFVVDPRKYLNFEALKAELVGAEKELGLVPQLLKASKGLPMRCFKRTGQYKSIALLASYAISTVCIAWVAPKFQHWVTYKLTGRRDFPGIQKL